MPPAGRTPAGERSKPPNGAFAGHQLHELLARELVTAMPKTRTSRPIVGDTALIDRHGQPGGEVVEADAAPEDMTFADWCTEAEPWYIGRASEPGWFTAFSAIKDAPRRIRDPKSRNWPGMFMSRFHADGYVEYALDNNGREMFTTSEKPESGGSAVRLWVGVEAGRKAAAS